jgi:hypothetical protein
MFTLIRDGGVPILFVLLFGLLCVGVAIRFAVKPSQSQMPLLRWLIGATAFFMVGGTAGDFGATFHTAASATAAAGDGPDFRTQIILDGLGESMSVAIMGCALLAFTALIIAVGQRRLALAGSL